MTVHSARNLAARPSEQLVRAVVVAMLAEARGHRGLAESVMREAYPGDEGSATILRAATTPATMAQAAWAGALTSTAVADFIGGLAPVSAAARLISLSLRVDLGRDASVMVPGLVPSAAVARYVAHGAPIPVAQLAVTGATLKPLKLAGIVTAASETLRSTGAESIIRALLRESMALSLDAALFSTAAAVDLERPAGLLNGVTPIAPTPGGNEAAMQLDLLALAAAVAPVGGANIVFAASPALALKLSLFRTELPFEVIPSAALAAGTIMAIASAALATAIDPVPTIEVATEGLLHHEDSSPLHIGTAGSPSTVAAPSRELFQSDLTALKVCLYASWGLRTSGAVAVINSASW